MSDIRTPMSQIVASVEELAPEWFTSVFRASGALSSGSVSQAAIESMQGGFTSRSVRARLSYVGGQGPASVIVKYTTDNAGTMAVAQAARLYELEVAFYRDLASIVTASVPGCHLAAWDPGSNTYTVVLEDLTGRARPGDVLTLLGLDEAPVVIGELVGLQAPTWNNPDLQGLSWLADPAGTHAMFDQLPLGLAPFLDRFGDKLDAEAVALFESVLPRAGDWVRSWAAPTVLQHGDFRADTMMFGDGDDAPPVTLIDFQTVRLGPPGVDLAYFIGASLSSEDRRAGDRELVRDYHERLRAQGVEGFSFDDAWLSYRQGALYGVLIFVGFAARVQASERGDQVFAQQIGRYAQMAIDLDAPQAARLT